jgi:tetratricopeptide (TPR) repeat protein
MIKSNTLIWIALLALNLVAVGCRSQMQVQSDLPKVEQEGGAPATTSSTSSTSAPSQVQTQSQASVPQQSASEDNMQNETAIAQGCFEAWKVAVKQKDEAKSMEMLQKLAKENPNVSNIPFWMGQVKDFFKKPKEALVYFKKAYSMNKFSSIQILRLAASLRKNGEFKEAETHYDNLLKKLEAALSDKHDENLIIVLASVRTGKAACLSAAGKKEEALEMVKKALSEDSGNLEAKELLKNLGN